MYQNVGFSAVLDTVVVVRSLLPFLWRQRLRLRNKATALRFEENSAHSNPLRFYWEMAWLGSYEYSGTPTYAAP